MLFNIAPKWFRKHNYRKRLLNHKNIIILLIYTINVVTLLKTDEDIGIEVPLNRKWLCKSHIFYKRKLTWECKYVFTMTTMLCPNTFLRSLLWL